jgi:RNA polymerase sigma factor (sigma-70 family)
VALAGKRREKLVRWVYLDETKGEETRFSIRSVRDRSRTPEEDYSHRELRRLLRRKALRLHPKYRMIFKACVLDEASIEQAARSLGITPSAAKARLHRVRQSLSAAMKKPNGQRGYL